VSSASGDAAARGLSGRTKDAPERWTYPLSGSVADEEPEPGGTFAESDEAAAVPAHDRVRGDQAMGT
jgi:hypothetical protein